MALTKEAALKLGLDMLEKKSSVKFFELRVNHEEALTYVAEALRVKGCTVDIDAASLTVRVVSGKAL